MYNKLPIVTFGFSLKKLISGKTLLINIFLSKFNGIKLDSSSLKDKHLNEIKIYQNIVIENLTKEIDEN